MTTNTQYDSVYKVGYVEPEASEFRFPNVFARGERKETPLLKVATGGSQVNLLKKLLEQMPEPLWMLYVLRVPRGEGEPGRYQSADTFLRTDVEAFLDRNRNLLESDARHNFWIKSLDAPALVVLDEHNLIYGYGLVNEWAHELQKTGWQEIPEDEVVLPDPHQHHYHAILDDDALKLLESVEWIHSPLQEQDQ